MSKPNVLFIMTDQQRADTISALGNPLILTPNLDRLVRRGVSFTNAYSPCPVCVPARYDIRTGCMPCTTGWYGNGFFALADGQEKTMERRCGDYLARSMGKAGYRTFGIGKFHTLPTYEELGYDRQLHAEEMYAPGDDRDAYKHFIDKEHPEYAHIEQLHGERTDMYYMPQTSAFPPELKVEGWAARTAAECIRSDDGRPFFGMVSFVGPHPPFTPPIPYNRMYNPDAMPGPVRGDAAQDHMDEQIPWMNYLIWGDEIDDARLRALKARYYGYITYIDECVGQILGAVEARKDADDTVICFFSDHGEHLGDHHAMQKESFFEASCRIPFLVSWPARLGKGAVNRELVSLVDLFGIATAAAGRRDLREGIDVIGMLEGSAAPRERLVSYYGTPGTPHFKLMLRSGEWKYIYMANGGREQLFNLREDPGELTQRLEDRRELADRLRRAAVGEISQRKDTALAEALSGGDVKAFPACRPFEYGRINQMAGHRGVRDFLVGGSDKGAAKG